MTRLYVKRMLQIGLLALFALLLSGLSMFIKTGADATDSETIGVVSTWGFPIHYRTTAPGMAQAQFDASRLWLNSVAWFAVLIAVWMLLAFRRSHRA